MYRVAICDDNSIFLNHMQQTVISMLTQLHIPHIVDTYGCGQSMLSYLNKSEIGYHIIFLDILLGDENGVEIAKTIRATDPCTSIVFVTSHQDYTLQGYEVRALHYLMKPIHTEQVREVLKYDYANQTQRDFLTISHGSTFRKVPVKKIIYLEIQGRKTALHLDNEIIYSNEKLSTVEELLPKDIFVRCHQSFIVNINNITELKRNQAITYDLQNIPISRAYIHQVQKMFLNKLGGNI